MSGTVTINPANTELSAARLKFKTVDLGVTLSGVKPMWKTKKTELLSDQYGATPLDRRVSGHTYSVETELGEVLNPLIWNVVFPNADLINNSGTYSILWRPKIGSSDLAQAGLLEIHPLTHDDTDKSADFSIFKACSSEESEIIHKADGQMVLKIVWNVYLDFGTNPPRLMLRGDPANGLINAIAAAAVAGANTGNGTVSAEAAHNATSKTETVTLLCLVAGATGKFQVTGSLSGPLGVAVVGTPFTSLGVDFTINDGGTHFAVNDSFTIAVTAANYV